MSYLVSQSNHFHVSLGPGPNSKYSFVGYDAPYVGGACCSVRLCGVHLCREQEAVWDLAQHPVTS